MLKFIRTVDKSIEDSFILNLEALGNLIDELDDHSPDTFCYGKLRGVLGGILEESADSLIGRKPSGSGQQVILHSSDGCTCNLSSEVAHLVLSKSEVRLAILEDNLQRPSHRVYPVCLEEVQLGVGGDESIPVGVLVTLCEEETYVTSCKLHVNGDVVAAETLAVPASFLRLVKECNESLSGIVLTVVMVLGLAHLDHTEVMELDVSGCYEFDDLSTCEPAVFKDIVEVYLFLDETLDHLYHEGNLAFAILLYPLGSCTVGTPVLLVSGIKLLLLHVVVAPLSLLTNEAEVHEHLSHAVRNAKEQSLEAEYHLVLDMGEYLANHLCLKSFSLDSLCHLP